MLLRFQCFLVKYQNSKFKFKFKCQRQNDKTKFGKRQIKNLPRLIFIINQQIFLFGAKLLLLSHLSAFALPFLCFICFLACCMLANLGKKFDNTFISPKPVFFIFNLSQNPNKFYPHHCLKTQHSTINRGHFMKKKKKSFLKARWKFERYKEFLLS